MVKSKSNELIWKWIVTVIVSIVVGNYMLMVLENTGVNVWIARSISVIIVGCVSIILYYLVIKKSATKS